MRGSLLRRTLLAVAVAAGAGASLARGQGPTSPPPVPAQGQPVMIQGTIVYTNPTAPAAPSAPAAPGAAAPCATCGAPEAGQAPGAAERHGWSIMPYHLRDWWHNHEHWCCWAHFNGYSCSSLASEYAFVFGSCRTFYGEPCMKGPPPPAYPGEPPLKNKCPNCILP